VSRVAPVSAVLSGVAGSVAYALEMGLDLCLLRPGFNDFTLLGRPLSRDPRAWPALGAGVHLLNGAAMGVLYARVRRFLPGPGWLRGLLFAQAENLLLWPLMPLVDRCHPARREGMLAPAWSRTSFVAAVLRHAAYGVSVGVLYSPRRSDPSEPSG
jgi:hypothetical protein